MGAEKFEFQAEVKQLLDLMIHSLYSNRDVFLRELISNASDACDRLRFEGLTRSDLLPDEPFSVNIHVDREARLLSVSDNGIGMSREEVNKNIGTIAKSGTAEFLRSLSKSADQKVSPELIGQFGVGFYASFMVASEITVITRKAGESESTRWASSGDGSYEIEDAERDNAGTTIQLKLKAAEGDDAIADYTDEWLLRQIVKRYSDFVAYPIQLKIEGADPPTSTEPLNSMKAIWRRPAKEVSDEEYAEFYKHIAHDWNEPLLHLATRIEGNFEARALLYLPSLAPFDLYHREVAHRGIQLYVKRVFIMDECRDLMPEYLRFVKGVVDAEDLSLNVSREMLQRNVQIEAIRKHLVKKVLDALKELKEGDREKYRGFWTQFGPVIKEGLLDLSQKRERILDLVLCESTSDESGVTSLADAVTRMPKEQEVIYYLTGPSREHLVNSPHVEAFVERNIEVLLFTDHVDEIWLEQNPPEFEGKKFQSVLKGEIDLDSTGEKEHHAEPLALALTREGEDLEECLAGRPIDELRLGEVGQHPVDVATDEARQYEAVEDAIAEEIGCAAFEVAEEVDPVPGGVEGREGAVLDRVQRLADVVVQVVAGRSRRSRGRARARAVRDGTVQSLKAPSVP